MFLGYMCGIFEDIINNIRDIPSEIKVWLYIGSIAFMIIFGYKAVKENLLAKKNLNLAWFVPVILLLLFIILLGV